MLFLYVLFFVIMLNVVVVLKFMIIKLFGYFECVFIVFVSWLVFMVLGCGMWILIFKLMFFDFIIMGLKFR